MPNHVQNRITFDAPLENILSVLRKNKTEETKDVDFSFQWIIPEPNSKDECPKEYIDNGDANVTHNDGKDWFNWYDWHCYFWGTKWDCYNVEIFCDQLEFQTAWSSPGPIFEKLAELFPNIPFTVQYADEDLGCNCGEIYYNGDGSDLEYINMDEEHTSEESLRFACDVWGLDYEEEMEYRKEENDD